jgi:hypothetical protein
VVKSRAGVAVTLVGALTGAIVLSGCPQSSSSSGASSSASASPDAGAAPKLDAVLVEVFNARAAELDLPFLWAEDKNGNHAVDPDEIEMVLGVEPSAKPDDYVANGAFTPRFNLAYADITRMPRPEPKDAREIAVRKELSQSRPTLVRTDLHDASVEDKKLVGHVIDISRMVEDLYAKQRGVYALRAQIKPDDLASKMLFYRNQGPRCLAPLTANDPACSALAGDDTKKKLSGSYPVDLLQNDKFCDSLSKDPDKKLIDPFTVVTRDASTGKLTAVPYSEAWKTEMNAIADALDGAAKDVTSPGETALREYLATDAAAFRSNDWYDADEAWVKMNADNSKWFIRVAPDETYQDACNLKALFHVTFGRINQASKKWQQKLAPMKDAMEKDLAAMAGPPYKERAVKFKLPDFVEVVLYAGNARSPFDATIGQSLPNFGKVADESRGRTIAMTNFFTDPASIRELEAQARSLFCTKTMALYTRDPEPLLESTILHEAAHNLGPNTTYLVAGKDDRATFGGPIASMLEEAKAETGSLYLLTWLTDRKEQTPEETNRALLVDVLWGFGQISHGMYDENKQPQSYAQLEAIQTGWLVKEGAMTWRANEKAANGTDDGCYEIDYAAMPAGLKSLEKTLLGVKARGDKKAAQALVADYVDAKGDRKAALDRITERMNRVPKATFLWAIDL